MNTESIIALLGRKSTDDALEQLFKGLGVRRRPELDEDEEEICAWIPVRRRGIEFGFEDEGHFKALNRQIGMGPLLFTQVIFYNEREDILPYQGELPHSLNFKDNREAARQKLRKYDSVRRSYIRDVWELPEYRIIVDFADDAQKISCIICQLRRYPSPPQTEPKPPLPTINELLDLFGVGPNDPKFLSTFDPCGISEHKDELIDDWEADFRDEYGFEIRFDETKCGDKKARKKLGMTSVSFYADRAFDARGWEGELPFNLKFDDDQNTMFAKTAEKPIKHHDGLTDGYAIWHFERFSLKILYSNMENRIFRVTLIAPWYLEEVEEDD